MSKITGKIILGGLLLGAALAPLGAYAGQITEAFEILVPPTPVLYYNQVFLFNGGASVPQFNPALGTLNTVAFSMSGDVTWVTPASVPELNLDPLLLNAGESAIVFSLPSHLYTAGQGGVQNPSGSGSMAATPAFVGTGTLAPVLWALDLSTGPENVDSLQMNPDGLEGTVVYNYTPAMATPEPATLELLGLGLACWLGLGLRRRALMGAGLGRPLAALSPLTAVRQGAAWPWAARRLSPGPRR